MSGKKIVFVAISTVIIALSLFGIVFWLVVFIPCVEEMRCRGNLAHIRRTALAYFLKDMNDSEYSAVVKGDGKLFFNSDFDLTEIFGREQLVCTVCKKAYVYSPVSPSGEKIAVVLNDKLYGGHFVVWCPYPCHKKHRSYLKENLSVSSYTDDQVSWYYQKIINYLTDEEFKKENEYRSSKGLQLLNKERLHMPEIYHANDVAEN
jgi:hypothetical protein